MKQVDEIAIGAEGHSDQLEDQSLELDRRCKTVITEIMLNQIKNYNMISGFGIVCINGKHHIPLFETFP